MKFTFSTSGDWAARNRALPQEDARVPRRRSAHQLKSPKLHQAAPEEEESPT